MTAPLLMMSTISMIVSNVSMIICTVSVTVGTVGMTFSTVSTIVITESMIISIGNVVAITIVIGAETAKRGSVLLGFLERPESVTVGAAPHISEASVDDAPLLLGEVEPPLAQLEAASRHAPLLAQKRVDQQLVTLSRTRI